MSVPVLSTPDTPQYANRFSWSRMLSRVKLSAVNVVPLR